ncbi:MAG: protein with DOMON-like ligand-binding domain protein, partial [Chitinophagaceae bacterium]
MLRSLFFLLFYIPLTVLAQGQPRSLSATRTAHPPRIDGDLSDSVWANTPVASDFIQNFPVFGKPSARRSAVRILYDDAALYVSAYLYDDPALIRRQLTPRDGESRQDVDYFSVFFDTYKDNQNGFQFLVTTANVQTDARLGGATSNGDFGDKTWDAVWQSATAMQRDGWTVEMRIPYISLRFTAKEVQAWGLQFLRFTRRDNSNDYWNPVNPSVNGFVNQFGLLAGLQSIRSPLRLSLSPYVSGGVRFNPG